MRATPDPRARAALADLEAGRPFAAHETFEALWRDPATPEGERPLWKGLAQVAAGWVHLARGNRVGARRVLARGADTLAGVDGTPAGIDVAALAREAAAVAAALDPVGPRGMRRDGDQSG